MTEKELVSNFFIEGYKNKNYDLVMTYLADDYIDHSPAGARSNQDAVGILKAVAQMFGNLQVEVLDIFAESGMVATRIQYRALHIGECLGIAATGKELVFEALENFKVCEEKIVESWGCWPDKQIEQMLMN